MSSSPVFPRPSSPYLSVRPSPGLSFPVPSRSLLQQASPFPPASSTFSPPGVQKHHHSKCPHFSHIKKEQLPWIPTLLSGSVSHWLPPPPPSSLDQQLPFVPITGRPYDPPSQFTSQALSCSLVALISPGNSQMFAPSLDFSTLCPTPTSYPAGLASWASRGSLYGLCSDQNWAQTLQPMAEYIEFSTWRASVTEFSVQHWAKTDWFLPSWKPINHCRG